MQRQCVSTASIQAVRRSRRPASWRLRSSRDLKLTLTKAQPYLSAISLQSRLDVIIVSFDGDGSWTINAGADDLSLFQVFGDENIAIQPSRGGGGD